MKTKKIRSDVAEKNEFFYVSGKNTDVWWNKRSRWVVADFRLRINRECTGVLNIRIAAIFFYLGMDVVLLLLVFFTHFSRLSKKSLSSLSLRSIGSFFIFCYCLLSLLLRNMKVFF